MANPKFKVGDVVEIAVGAEAGTRGIVALVGLISKSGDQSYNISFAQLAYYESELISYEMKPKEEKQ